MKQEVLRLERVTYRSDGVNILDNFSFHIVRGEIMGLQWEKVDFDNSRVKIDKALVTSKSKGTYLGNTKTSDIRYLNLPGKLWICCGSIGGISSGYS